MRQVRTASVSVGERALAQELEGSTLWQGVKFRGWEKRSDEAIRGQPQASRDCFPSVKIGRERIAEQGCFTSTRAAFFIVYH
jgi:hypothetical protein